MLRYMLPADSTTTDINAARHGGDCCFFKDRAITANLCSSETLHKELYEVAKGHDDLNYHKCLCRSQVATLSPAYNAVLFMPFLGTLVALGDGLLTVKPSKPTIILNHKCLSKIILNALEYKNFVQVKYTHGFFSK